LDALMKEHLWPVTLSLGVVTFFTAPKDPRDMIRTAERQMYTVKKAGKNNIRYATFHG
jgi:GGDEF domain-containing protein